MRSGVPALLLLSLLLAAAGCERAENPPPEVLRDSLGLDQGREVRTLRMENREGAERISPDTVHLRPGALADFLSTDGWVRTVTFVTDSLGPEAVAFLERTGQAGSPPLVERDARFVVDFTDAPAGRYPFVVEGSGSPARGAVVVSPR